MLTSVMSTGCVNHGILESVALKAFLFANVLRRWLTTSQ